MVLTDVVIRDTLPQQADLRFGHSVLAMESSTISGERVVVDGAYELGLLATNAATIALTDVTVMNVRPSMGGEVPFGYGAAAVGGTVNLTRFTISDVSTCGVFVSTRGDFGVFPGALDLDTGVIARTEIGACVQVEGYDLSRLMRGVEYRDNVINLDSTSLPIPELPPLD